MSQPKQIYALTSSASHLFAPTKNQPQLINCASSESEYAMPLCMTEIGAYTSQYTSMIVDRA